MVSRKSTTTISSPGELARRLAFLPNGVFAIDGYHGVGKTTLARELAPLLGMSPIHLDDFLVPGQGGFVACLRDAELSRVLRQSPVVVEGVCMLAVMERLGIAPLAHIYVHGREPGTRSPRGMGSLAAEVIAYHREYRPAEVADYLYAANIVSQEVAPLESTNAQVDVALIQAKTKLALALAGGGMLTLVIGLAVLLYGVTGKDHALIKAASMEISASGLGGVIMITSVLWAFFAYKARPTYTRTHQRSEKYDGSHLVEFTEHESATQAAADPESTTRL